MAQIDTSFYSNIKAPQPESPLNALAQVLPVAQAMQKNKLMQQEMADSETMNSLYKTAVGADGKVDRAALLTGAAKGGLGSKIPGLQKQFAEMDKDKAATLKTELENGLKRFEVVGQAMSGVRDQNSYTQAVQQIAQMFPDMAASIPAVYDPAAVERNRQKAVSVKDQMEQAHKQLTLAEQIKHNRTTEGISGGNLALSRERLAMEKAQPKGQYDSERGVLVDPRTGVATPVTMGGAALGPKDKTKDLTEGQAKAVAFASRMQASDKIINDLAAAGKDFSTPGSRAPFGIGQAVNAMNSEKGQKLDQAKRDFINAVLRRESGAVISDSEFDNAEKQYFPQPGEGAGVRDQKANNRRIALDGMKADIPKSRAGIVDEIAGKGKAAGKPSLDDIFK